MGLRSSWLSSALDKVPGKKLLGMYRFLPAFFLLGAALEFSMINWHVGEVNFCTSIPNTICFIYIILYSIGLT